MPKLNQYQALCRALERRGETRDANARTTKYAVYTRRYGGMRNEEGALCPTHTDARWLVGKSGALRIAGKIIIAGSFPAHKLVKAALLKEGRAD